MCESLRIALELAARPGGVTSSELARSTGRELAWAATRLARCLSHGYVEVTAGMGLRCDPLVYVLTDTGRRFLLAPNDPGPRWTFDALLRAFGSAPF